MSTLQIIPNIERKTMRVCGSIAVGEVVALTLVGISALDGLRFRVRHGGRDCAVFPAPDTEDAWVEDLDGNATGLLNLNTVQMRSAFFGVMDQTTIMFGLIVEQNDESNLICEGSIGIKNWPANEGEDIPYDLGDWPNTVDELDARLVEMAAAVEAHKTDVAAHAGLFALKASKSVVDAHIADVSNPHSVTLVQLGGVSAGEFSGHVESSTAHATRFAAKADKSALESHTNGAVRSHADIDSDLDGIASAFPVHSHGVGGTGGGQIAHASLSGSGSKTHAEIDSALHGLQSAVDFLTGAQSGVASLGALRFSGIAEACRQAAAMPNNTDKLRKDQFAALLDKIIAAVEAVV